jgi:hypothetical protein
MHSLKFYVFAQILSVFCALSRLWPFNPTSPIAPVRDGPAGAGSNNNPLRKWCVLREWLPRGATQSPRGGCCEKRHHHDAEAFL